VAALKDRLYTIGEGRKKQVPRAKIALGVKFSEFVSVSD
jgi:hypothetical protein